MPFGQHLDTELWNNQFAETKSLGLPVSRGMRGLVYMACRDKREFKQIATAGATTAAVTEKVWGEYVPSVCQILQSEIQRCQEHELRSSKSLLFCFL